MLFSVYLLTDRNINIKGGVEKSDVLLDLKSFVVSEGAFQVFTPES